MEEFVKVVLYHFIYVLLLRRIVMPLLKHEQVVTLYVILCYVIEMLNMSLVIW